MPGLPVQLGAAVFDCFGQRMVAYRTPIVMLPLADASTPGCLAAVRPSMRVIIVSGSASFQLLMAVTPQSNQCKINFQMEDGSLSFLLPSSVTFTGDGCFPGGSHEHRRCRD